jgi:hypothetical protein
MTHDEGSQRLCHAARVLHVQQVRGAGEDEPFRLWQGGQQELVGLAESGTEGIAFLAVDGEDRLGDAPQLGLAEGPFAQGG